MGNIFKKLLTKLGLIKKKKKNKEDSNYQETLTNNNYNYSNYHLNQNNYPPNKNITNINTNANNTINTSNNTANANTIQTPKLELSDINIKATNNNINQKIDSTKIYDVSKINNQNINTIWDIIKARENTQAEHIINCLPDDEWIDMVDLKNRIKLQYNVEYQNEKSLYPYIKTLTDINLVKVNNSGKKRTWKKNIIIIERE